MGIALLGAVAEAKSGSFAPGTAGQKAEWQRAIAEARRVDPGRFEAVAAIRRQLPALDRARRGDVVVVLPLLEGLGRNTYWPLVEELLFTARPAGLGERPWHDWQVGVIEALGRLREEKSEPLWLTLLARRPDDFALTRAIAEAAGRLGAPATVGELVKLARGGDPDRAAILEGMGECRTRGCISALAEALAGADSATTAIVARSLGRAASSWAWQTEALAATGEGPTVRRLAAEALVAKLGGPKLQASGGDAIETALRMVEARETPALLQKVQSSATPAAQPVVRRLLDTLH